jgi:signal transduction histidine kinase
VGHVRTFLTRHARTLGVLVPLHLVAFVALYMATYRLVESEVIRGNTEEARSELQHELQEVAVVAEVHPGDLPGGHQFERFLATHRIYDMQLFLPDGTLLAGQSSTFTPSAIEIRRFMTSDEPDSFWMTTTEEGSWIRGLSRLVAVEGCQPCHKLGETRAVASMNLDVSPEIDTLRGRLRLNLGALILVWVCLVGFSTSLVKRRAQQAGRRLEQELAAAAAGDLDPGERSSSLVFDPVSAELHKSVRRFLRHQQQTQTEMASRLAHTDQLASLGRLAAGLAHEIKNPLAGIQGALEILRQDIESGEGANGNLELYDEMLSELKRVNETLQLLLSSARPSPPQLVETDLRGLLEDLRTHLQLEVAPGRLAARVDAGKIRQVLVNLVSNGAEALESGGTITIRAALLGGDGGVVLSVQDDGPGVPEDQLSKIFEPFFTSKFTGTGLGLAIARSLVEQHGGSLQVESQLGVGTSFLVLLPAIEPEEESAADDGAGE